MKLLLAMAGWVSFVGIAIYLPIMRYRGEYIPLTDRAIIIGILGIYFILYGKEA